MARMVEVIVETGKDGFGCFISKDSEYDSLGINGFGKTAKAAIDDFLICRDEVKLWFKEEGKEFPDVEFEYIFDVGAFLSYYPINVTAFAKYIGMNASLLRQYATGIKVPKGKSVERIRSGIATLAHDICAGRLIDRPVLQYV